MVFKTNVLKTFSPVLDNKTTLLLKKNANLSTKFCNELILKVNEEEKIGEKGLKSDGEGSRIKRQSCKSCKDVGMEFFLFFFHPRR